MYLVDICWYLEISYWMLQMLPDTKRCPETVSFKSPGKVSCAWDILSVGGAVSAALTALILWIDDRDAAENLTRQVDDCYTLYLHPECYESSVFGIKESWMLRVLPKHLNIGLTPLFSWHVVKQSIASEEPWSLKLIGTCSWGSKMSESLGI